MRTPLAPLPIPDCPNLLITVDNNKKFAFASWMHLLSILWSLQLSAKMLKWWLTPFTEIGFQNLEFRNRFTWIRQQALGGAFTTVEHQNFSHASTM
jgi:hypothetical protein